LRDPSGAPLPAAPPCILHRAFPRTAGDRHGLPFRVRAKHRGARFMRQSRWCMGLASVSCSTPPSPSADGAHDGLPARVDGDPLHPDHLRLTLAPVPVQASSSTA
jgi:hypothetical protein